MSETHSIVSRVPWSRQEDCGQGLLAVTNLGQVLIGEGSAARVARVADNQGSGVLIRKLDQLVQVHFPRPFWKQVVVSDFHTVVPAEGVVDGESRPGDQHVAAFRGHAGD